MAEHKCGPTPAQVHDAQLRGETIGTYPRCDECAAREDELLRGVLLLPPLHDPDGGRRGD